MDWLRQAAEWLRELLMRQAWIEPARPILDRTPDWILLATPLTLLVLVLLLFRPRRRGRASVEGRREAETRALKKPKLGSRAQQTKTQATAEAPTSSRQTGRARVFLSYSRKDAGFTTHLAEALEARGHVVDFDRSTRDPDNVDAGISADEEWWKRLQSMIAGADVMVFVVTPDSAASRVCDDEIEYARGVGKRIIPVLRKPIDFAAAPPRLAALNVKLSFEQDASFKQSLTALGAVLDVDVAWRREGARLMALAAKWDQDQRPDAQLLRVGAVEQARTWMARRPAAEPEAGPLLVAFLDASRSKETRDTDAQRRLVQRGFAQPAATGLAEGRGDTALRLMGAGALLSDDPGLLLDTDDEPIHRHKLWRAGLRGVQQSLMAALHGHEDAIHHLAVSRDGERVLTGSLDKTARLWRVLDGNELAALRGHDGLITSVSFSPDGTLALTSSADKTARLWNTASGAEIKVFRHDEAIESAVFSPDASRVITTSKDHTARLWDIGGAEIAALKGHEHWVQHGAFSPDGKRLLTGDGLGLAKLWDGVSGAEIASLRGHRENGKWISCVAFSPDGSLAATGSGDSCVRIWDGRTGAEIRLLPEQSDTIKVVAFSPDGGKLLSCDGEGEARLWDVRTGDLLVEYRGHRKGVEAAAFSADGARILTGSLDGTARIWDVASGVVLKTFETGANVVDVAFAKNGARAVTAGAGEAAYVWDTALSDQIAVLKSTQIVTKVAFSPEGSRVITEVSSRGAPENAQLWTQDGVEITLPDERAGRIFALSRDGGRALTRTAAGVALLWNMETLAPIGELAGKSIWTGFGADPDWRRLLIAYSDGDVRVWDGRSAAAISELHGAKGQIAQIDMSADGARAVTASSGGRLAHLWNVDSGVAIAELHGHQRDLTNVYMAPDGARAVTEAGQDVLRLWDGSSGAGVAELVSAGQPKLVSFSPDARRLAVVTAHTAHLFDAVTGAQIAALSGHEGAINCISFSPQRSWIITGSDDTTARVWDMSRGEQIAIFRAHQTKVTSAAVSPDGARVLTGGEDGALRLWDIATGAEIALLRGHKDRVFSIACSADGARAVSGSRDRTARVWDIGWSTAFTGDRGVFLAAALDCGLGRRSEVEKADALMRDAPDDLYAALMERLKPEQRERVAEVSRVLRMPRDLRCYLTPPMD